jgi:hypothetical protein
MFGADRDLLKILTKPMLGSVRKYSEYSDVTRKKQVKRNYAHTTEEETCIIMTS